MLERDIPEESVEDTIQNGEIIETYLDDKPYPSFLALKLYDKPLHVVFAKNEEENEIIVITAYYPNSDKWSDNYTKRIKR